jgi:hypothetical protein
LLQRYGLQVRMMRMIRMIRKGNCGANTVMKRFFLNPKMSAWQPIKPTM